MLFETRAGPVRLRWNQQGLTAIEMPELPPRELRAELAKQNGNKAPPFVADAARLLRRHLAGEAQDLEALPLDLSVLAPFQRAVYEKVRGLPPGRTTTYGEIAALLGKPGASRAVGQALGRNPFLVAVPCHRVLGAGGAPGGFSAPGGVVAKQRLLALEGVTLAVDHGLTFDPVAAVEHLRGRDRRLAKFIEQVGPFRLRCAEPGCRGRRQRRSRTSPPRPWTGRFPPRPARWRSSRTTRSSSASPRCAASAAGRWRCCSSSAWRGRTSCPPLTTGCERGMRACAARASCPRPRSCSRSASAGARIAALPAGISGASSICRLRQIEDQDLGRIGGLQAQRALVAYRGAVARGQLLAVQLDRAARHLHPGVPSGAELVGDALALSQKRPVDRGVLIDLHRSLAPVPRRKQAKRSLPLVGREVLLLVAGREAALLGDDPDLQEVHRVGPGGVELAVRDAGTRAHALHVAGPDLPTAAGGVAMCQPALEHVGQDLHVPVRMRAESLPWLHGVVVDHAQRAEPHVFGVVVVAEREGVPGIEPTGVGVEAVAGLAQLDHSVLRLRGLRLLPRRKRGMPDHPVRFESCPLSETGRYPREMVKIQYCNS